MSRADAQHIFTHWLQNVLNMPLPLRERPMLRLCEELGVSPDEVLQVADELDLNVALLDDLLASADALADEPAEAPEEE